MAWMFRAACKRQEAVHAVDERPRAPPSCVLARHEEDDDRGRCRRRERPWHPSVLLQAILRRRQPRRYPRRHLKRHPKVSRPALGDSAPAVATTLRVAAGLYKHCAGGFSRRFTTIFRGSDPTSCSRRWRT